MGANPFSSDEELMTNVVQRMALMGIPIKEGKEYRSLPGAIVKCHDDSIEVYDSANPERLVGTVTLDGTITYAQQS